VNIFFWRKKKLLLNEEDNRLIVKSIRQAEKNTSGEIRVFIESRCSWMDSMNRAAEIFFSLEMQKTELRNAVLVYVAIKDRQVALFGDEGIHNKLGDVYWNEKVAEMISSFQNEDYGKGVAECVIQVGEALHLHFPYMGNADKNELPDEIVFGK
jgi:uncharacterized membrane protein